VKLAAMVVVAGVAAVMGAGCASAKRDARGAVGASGSGYGVGLVRQAHIFGERPRTWDSIPFDIATAHAVPPPPTNDLYYRRPRQGPRTKL
jgi:hypothetical protein